MSHPRSSGTVLVNSEDGPCGIPDPMLFRHSQALDAITVGHPLEYSEKHWDERQMAMDMAMLRQTQGCYAPLHLKMELEIASRVKRLPCLPSSNLMTDSLTGRLDTIDFDSILNDPMDSEIVGHPHMMIEKQLGLLHQSKMSILK
jgi:proteasome maturation protein